MVPTLPGVPWWAVVAIAFVLTVIGAIIAGTDLTAGVPSSLWVFFLAGTILAVLAARRRAVFTGMVQPPLIAAIVVFLGGKVFGGLATFDAGFNVVKIFPMMAVGTGIAVVLGLIRMLAQPLRSVAPKRNPADQLSA